MPSPDSDQSWQALLQYLSSLPSASVQQLRTHPETRHYLRRTVQHVLRHSDTLEHLKIIETLASVFPNEVEEFKGEEPQFSYSYSDMSKATMDARVSSSDSHAGAGRPGKKRRRAATIGSAAEDLFRYSPHLIPATYRGPLLTVKDLGQAATLVCSEATNEGRKSLGLPPLSRSDSPVSLAQPRPRSSQGFYTSPPQRREMPFLCPVLTSELEGDAQLPVHSPRKHARSTKVHFERKSPHQGLLKLTNGFDVVEAFASGKLQTESESVYLNYADSKPWNPYSLVVVLKTRVNAEHFVVSKFGIVHVFPNGESSIQSFAEWLREAGLFTLLQQIPFFKHYLQGKFLKRWYKILRCSQLVRVRTVVSKSCLKLFPFFSDALLKIQSLNEELLTVPFHVLMPLGGYSKESFDRSIQASQAKARRYLQRYIKYCRRVVAGAIEATESLALELEMEKRHQPFVSDLPLSVQKEKHAKLERDLEAAQLRASKTDRFVVLANQMVISCLLRLARDCTQHWAEVTLRQGSGYNSSASKWQGAAKSLDGHNCDSREQNIGKGSAFLFTQMRLEETGTCMLYRYLISCSQSSSAGVN